MSFHEFNGEHSYQPEQSYDQLDDLTRVRAKLMVSGYDGLSPAEIALADQFIEYLFSPDFPEELLPEEPNFPQGLGPKILELWQEEDRRNGTLPPDAQ